MFASYVWSHNRNVTCLLPTELEDFSDFKKDAVFVSEYSCRFICTMCDVSEACVCRMSVSICMNRYYSCTQMRGLKKVRAVAVPCPFACSAPGRRRT